MLRKDEKYDFLCSGGVCHVFPTTLNKNVGDNLAGPVISAPKLGAGVYH